MKSIFATTTIAAAVLMTGMKIAPTPAQQLQTFATTFVESLDDDQRAEAMKPFADESRTGWHFIPKDSRKGLTIGAMNDAQRTAALRMVRVALSEVGYDKVNRIRLLESIVAQYEGEGRRWARDPEMYSVTLFGDFANPKADQRWGLSFEGHHISINLVCRGAEVLDSTPQFLGAHPAAVPADYTGKLPGGTRVLAVEEDLGFQLIRSLTPPQQSTAIFDTAAPAEARFAGEPQPIETEPPVGIAYSDMTPDQQAMLRQIVEVYAGVMADPIAEARMALIDSGGWDSVHFGWAGATQPGTGHYYRIRGDSFLIELVNSQPDAMGTPANHLHCFLRDLTGDFDLTLRNEPK